MAPLPWLLMLEQLAYQQLMKSPTFHRSVETVVKAVHRVRYGIPHDELGGTKIDEPQNKFGRHFVDELRGQLGRAEQEQSNNRAMQAQQKSKDVQEIKEDAESAWQDSQQRASEVPKQGFMGDYMDALRGQLGQKKPPS